MSNNFELGIVYREAPKVNFPIIPKGNINIFDVSNGVGNGGPINLWKDGGRSPINGYNPFIIRNPNEVMVPRSINSIDDKSISCDWPSYAGSKYQKWVNEDVAMYQYQMRPIINPKEYDIILSNMFNLIVKNSTGLDNTQNIQNGPDQYAAVSCGSGSSPEEMSKIILGHIANAVAKMPTMQKNGSYGSEQFRIIDPEMYKFFGPDNKIYYQIIFNLFNTLRSITTRTYCTVQVIDNIMYIYRMSFVNNKMWSATEDMPDNSGIQNYNLGPAGNRTIMEVPHALEINSNEVPWLYANTLLNQKFNEYGFYDPENNVPLTKIGIPESLKSRIENNQKYNQSYLFEPSTVRYNGIVPDPSKGPNHYKSSENNGTPKTVLSDPSIIYSPQLILQEKSGQLKPVVDANRNTNKITGFIRS